MYRNNKNGGFMTRRICICGINTATLPKLSNDESQALLRKNQGRRRNCKG